MVKTELEDEMMLEVTEDLDLVSIVPEVDLA